MSSDVAGYLLGEIAGELLVALFFVVLVSRGLRYLFFRRSRAAVRATAPTVLAAGLSLMLFGWNGANITGRDRAAYIFYGIAAAVLIAIDVARTRRGASAEAQDA